MKRNEILGEHKKGIKAVKYNKKPTNPADEHAKAKEKLKPIKPMEGYNVNGVDAQHERELKAHHKAELKKKADAGDENAKKRLQALHDKEQARRDEFNARMERESIQQENRWGRRDFGYDDSGMSLAPGNDEGPDSWDYSAAHDRIGAGDPRRPRRHAPTADVPHDVYIDGRKWKTFDSASHANNVARKLLAKGKSVTVKASSTEEAMGDPVGTVSSATPDGKVSIKTSTGDEIQTSKDALIPGANGTLQMKPDAAGGSLKPGAKVVSTAEDMTALTTDSSSPIDGNEENVDLRRLRELTGQPALPVEEGDDKLATRRIVPGQETPPGINRLTGKPIEEPPVSSTPAPAGPTLSSRYGPDYEGAPAAYTITVKGKDYKFAGRDKTGPGTGSIIKVPGGAVGIRGLAPVSVEVSDDGMYYLAPATNESTDNELLQNMLSIAGLR